MTSHPSILHHSVLYSTSHSIVIIAVVCVHIISVNIHDLGINGWGLQAKKSVTNSITSPLFTCTVYHSTLYLLLGITTAVLYRGIKVEDTVKIVHRRDGCADRSRSRPLEVTTAKGVYTGRHTHRPSDRYERGRRE
jgi:hypothetical protein